MYKRMSIDANWLEHELTSLNKKFDIESFISNLVCSARSKNAKEQIACNFDLVAASGLDNKTYEIFDSLRHAFTSYISGGLYDLYIYQSNEAWYPKIVLTHELKPNDIRELPDSIEIYRGCDISELNINNYGQSWSTSIEIAKEFAFQHYSSQSWYKKDKRCVLKATIKKEDVLFSRQNHHEKEIAVNIEGLFNVQKT